MRYEVNTVIRLFIIYCFFLLLFLNPCAFLTGKAESLAAENGYDSYMIYVETVVSEGRTTDSGLVMIPVDNEYRLAGFRRLKSEGSAPAISISALQDAVNDALARIVVEKGLKSVKSSQEVVDGRYYDITRMRHEGVIKYPYSVKEIKSETPDRIRVEVEADFSPVSMPSEWGWQGFKKSVSKSFSDVLSVFRHLWE